MTYKIDFRKEAVVQLAELRKGDKNTYTKCFDVLLAIVTDPRNGIGKPERLKGYEDAEVYSRRVNDKDRFIYEIVEDKHLIEIISCIGHYDDH
jgi:toxin YoeB